MRAYAGGPGAHGIRYCSGSMRPIPDLVYLSSACVSSAPQAGEKSPPAAGSSGCRVARHPTAIAGTTWCTIRLSGWLKSEIAAHDSDRLSKGEREPPGLAPSAPSGSPCPRSCGVRRPDRARHRPRVSPQPWRRCRVPHPPARSAGRNARPCLRLHGRRFSVRNTCLMVHLRRY